ncbi:MAG: hypothetical protein U0V48_07425 [Anaerolineales bacterium]
MDATLNQIFNVLTEPAGSLIYHLILVFSIAGAFQAALVHWRTSEFPQTRRMMFGLGLMLVAKFALFLLSGLGFQGVMNLPVILPPLDRALTLFSLLWMLWLWNFPEPSRLADAVIGFLSILVFVGLALSLVEYAQEPNLPPFNSTMNDGLWQLASIAVAVFGLFLLILRRPNGWGYGLAVFTLAFAGHLLHMILGRLDGNFPGAVRLAYLAAYPMLMTLPQRFPAPVTGSFTSIKQHAPGGRTPAVQHRPENLPRAVRAGGRIQRGQVERGDRARHRADHARRPVLFDLPHR